MSGWWVWVINVINEFWQRLMLPKIPEKVNWFSGRVVPHMSSKGVNVMCEMKMPPKMIRRSLRDSITCEVVFIFNQYSEDLIINMTKEKYTEFKRSMYMSKTGYILVKDKDGNEYIINASNLCYFECKGGDFVEQKV